jgi:hypothetical protein
MQKSIIIESYGFNDDLKSNFYNHAELNKHLADGWIFVSATPFGVSTSNGCDRGSRWAVILVIIEKR